MNKHQEYCNEHKTVKIELPEKGTMLKFKNYHKSQKVPFIVYADFESYIKPLHSCEPNPESSYTKQYQKHEPSSFCYFIKCFDDVVYEPNLVSYTEEDAAQKFVKMLEKNVIEISNLPAKKMIFRKKEKERFDEETKCWICNGNSLMTLKIIRLEIIAILLVGIEELLIKYAISCIENLILHLWCFITLVAIIATYS